MIATELGIIEQLIEIYYKEEWWHQEKKSYTQAVNYYNVLLKKGNILYYEIEGRVVGYVEFWRINFEQWGKIVCHEKIYIDIEDISNGNICYVTNVWINKEYRNTDVVKTLTLNFFKQNYRCDYFVGEALRKKTQPIKVFKRSELHSKLFTGG